MIFFILTIRLIFSKLLKQLGLKVVTKTVVIMFKALQNTSLFIEPMFFFSDFISQ